VLSTPRLAAALALPTTEPILLSSGQLLSLLVLVLEGVGLIFYHRSRAAP
jgi:hypothetical protein